MPRPQKQYTEEAKKEILDLYNKSKHTSEQRRLMCLKLRVVHGKSAEEISEITNYKKGTVKDMISKYNRDCITPFLYKTRKSNNRKLTPEEEKDVLSSFAEKASNGQILVVSDIHKAFEEKIGSSITLTTVYNILSRNGWRKIMPRSKHPNKASDEAIAAYKKNHY